MFSYSSRDQVCYILDSGDRECNSVSGPRQPSVQSCADNTVTTTTTPATTSAHSPDNFGAIAGTFQTVGAINVGGICHEIDIFPNPISSHSGPNSGWSWVDESIVGCGTSSCSGENCGSQFDDCYFYNMKDGWIKIASPYDHNPAHLNGTNTLHGSLVNANNTLYYITDLGSDLQMYSTSEDKWSTVEPRLESPTINFRSKCLIDLGSGEIFVQFGYPGIGTENYKLVLDTLKWIELPPNNYRDNVGSSCVKVDLPEGGVGVMMIGGHWSEYDDETEKNRYHEMNTVEILNLATGSWTKMEPFDERWILLRDNDYGTYSDYGFLYLGGKPTIIGRFNDTNINVMEQFDVEKGSWTLEDFDMTDPPCGSSLPCLYYAANIPSNIFPPC